MLNASARFTFGRHIFMHNGTVDQFPAIKKGLVQIIGNDEYNNIAGGTDSEHLAALYMTYLSNGEGKEGWERRYGVDEMYKALLRAMGSAIKLQEQILGSRAQPNSLNIAVTDGLQLVAVRFRNHPTEQPPSLYYSTKAGVTLNRKYPGHANGAEVENLNASLEGSQHGEHLIVSSEPTTYDEKEWKLIEKNHAVVWSDGSGVVTLSIDH